MDKLLNIHKAPAPPSHKQNEFRNERRALLSESKQPGIVVSSNRLRKKPQQATTFLIDVVHCPHRSHSSQDVFFVAVALLKSIELFEGSSFLKIFSRPLPHTSLQPREGTGTEQLVVSSFVEKVCWVDCSKYLAILYSDRHVDIIRSGLLCEDDAEDAPEKELLFFSWSSSANDICRIPRTVYATRKSNVSEPYVPLLASVGYSGIRLIGCDTNRSECMVSNINQVPGKSIGCLSYNAECDLAQPLVHFLLIVVQEVSVLIFQLSVGSNDPQLQNLIPNVSLSTLREILIASPIHDGVVLSCPHEVIVHLTTMMSFPPDREESPGDYLKLAPLNVVVGQLRRESQDNLPIVASCQEEMQGSSFVISTKDCPITMTRTPPNYHCMSSNSSCLFHSETSVLWRDTLWTNGTWKTNDGRSSMCVRETEEIISVAKEMEDRYIVLVGSIVEAAEGHTLRPLSSIFDGSKMRSTRVYTNVALCTMTVKDSKTGAGDGEATTTNNKLVLSSGFEQSELLLAVERIVRREHENLLIQVDERLSSFEKRIALLLQQSGKPA